MKRLFIITLALFCTACNTDWRRKYDEVYPSQNGISMVRKDNKYGLVNAEGTVVAPLKYDYIYKDNYGYTLVKGDKVGLWNNRETEKCFIPAVYTKINKNTYYYENYILVYDGDTILFVDKEGNEYDAQVTEVRKIDAFFGYPQRDNEVKIGDKYYRPNIESKRPPRKE